MIVTITSFMVILRLTLILIRSNAKNEIVAAIIITIVTTITATIMVAMIVKLIVSVAI